MLESLVDVVRGCGLELNVKKNEILSTEVASAEATCLVTDYGGVEFLGADDEHKYLGRGFCRELRNRGRAALDHKINCVWIKYSGLDHVLQDKQISM